MLSLKLYKSEQPSSATATKPTDKDESKVAEKTTQECGATTTAAATTATVKEDEGGHNPLEGLDDITKTCFEVVQLHCWFSLVTSKRYGRPLNVIADVELCTEFTFQYDLINK